MKRKNTEREYIAAHGKLSKGKRSFIYAWKCVRMFYLYSMGISNPLNNTSNSIHFLIVTFYIIHWGFNNFDQYFISDCMSLPTCSHARNDIGECCGIKKLLDLWTKLMNIMTHNNYCAFTYIFYDLAIYTIKVTSICIILWTIS